MHKTAPLACAFLLSAPCLAQADHWQTSPRGYILTEGESALNLIGSEASLRYQQIDTTNAAMTQRRRIAFRRDGVAPLNAAYGARTLEMEIVLSESDLSQVSRNFASNYKANTTVAFARRFVNLPDWTVAPPTGPAPHDLVLMLDNAWSYLGKAATGNDLLWEVRVWSNSAAGQPYPFDFALPDPTAQAGVFNGHTDLGEGCKASGHAGHSHLETFFGNTGSKFILDVAVEHNAENQPHWLLLGFQQQTVSLPWLCADYHIGGTTVAILPLGASDASGNLEATLRFDHANTGIGLPLVFQAFALDPVQPAPFVPVALTTGNSTSIPANPTGSPATVAYLYSTSDPDSAHIADFGPRPGGVIIVTNE